MVLGGRGLLKLLKSRGGHENRASMVRISVLIRKKRDQSQLSSTCKDTINQKTVTCKPERGFSRDTKSASTLILDIPTSTSIRNKCLLFKPSSPQYFCYSSLKWQRQLLSQELESFESSSTLSLKSFQIASLRHTDQHLSTSPNPHASSYHLHSGRNCFCHPKWQEIQAQNVTIHFLSLSIYNLAWHHSEIIN